MIHTGIRRCAAMMRRRRFGWALPSDSGLDIWPSCTRGSDLAGAESCWKRGGLDHQNRRALCSLRVVRKGPVWWRPFAIRGAPSGAHPISAH